MLQEVSVFTVVLTYSVEYHKPLQVEAMRRNTVVRSWAELGGRLCVSCGLMFEDCCMRIIHTEPLRLLLLEQGPHGRVNVEATLTNRDKFLFSIHIYWLLVQGLIHTNAAKRRKGTSQGSFTIDKRRDKAVFLWEISCRALYVVMESDVFSLLQEYISQLVVKYSNVKVTQIADDMYDVCLHRGFCFMYQMKQHIVLQSLCISTIFHEEAMVFAEGFIFRWTWELDDNFICQVFHISLRAS
ncbi:hypothetical protein Bca101_079891 [Brassica carinata]